MRTLEFPFDSINEFTFEPKPQPVPGNLRPVYRIALIVLVLKINCHRNTASLLKLQFFNWILKNPSLQETIRENLSEKSAFSLKLIHVDPMVNLALKYAFADGLLVVTSSSKYKLTEKGSDFAEQIINAEDPLLSDERELLLHIGRKISEVKLRGELL